MLALWRGRGGWGFIKRDQAAASKPRRDSGNRHSVCVYTNTHISTQVQQLCLDRAPLSMTFLVEVPAHSYECTPAKRITSCLRLCFYLLPSGLDVDVLLLHFLIARDQEAWFRFHQVYSEARLSFLKEPAHILTLLSHTLAQT